MMASPPQGSLQKNSLGHVKRGKDTNLISHRTWPGPITPTVQPSPSPSSQTPTRQSSSFATRSTAAPPSSLFPSGAGRSTRAATLFVGGSPFATLLSSHGELLALASL
ncbi:hypothetical protein CFC21_022456 [Triticum aestivum]|uniref:Uncharacterized protein n=2 Tax=Triticum aestivum TaxID=4565 RepID=A0A9R1J7W9_WHEAT|nr:hypothetical protein CFC21_022456 [Triticum aestivum]